MEPKKDQPKEQSKDSKPNNEGTNLPAKNLVDYKPDAQLIVQGLVVKATGMNDADAVLLLDLANKLKIPPVFILTNVHIVKGKYSAGYKIIAALLQRGGCTIKVVENYVQVLHFVDGSGFPIALSKEQFEAGKYFSVIVKDGVAVNKDKMPPEHIPVMPVPAPYIFTPNMYDRRTTVRISRMINGVLHEHEDSYYLHEAYKAQYFGGPGKDDPDPKFNWVIHTKMMLLSKALPRAANMIGADLCFGMQELGDMYHAEGIKYTITEDGDYEVLPD